MPAVALARDTIAAYDADHPLETWYDRRMRDHEAAQHAQEEHQQRERELTTRQQNNTTAYRKLVRRPHYECIKSMDRAQS
jgi:hypothetical protein